MFLDASQLIDDELHNSPVFVKPSGKHQVNTEPHDNPVAVKPSDKRPFGQTQSEKDIKESCVLKKVLQNT